MRSIRRLIKGEDGQSTAMIVSMLFLLVLFVGMVANVGQAVNRRIALQTLADAGAFTGATVMGVGMNQLAYWNGWLQYLWVGYSWVMNTAIKLHFYAFSCNLADSFTSMYKGGYTAVYALMTLLNIGFDGKAAGDAARVTEFNAKDLFPSEWDTNLSWGEPGVTLMPTADSPAWELPILGAGLFGTGARDLGMVVELENVPDGTDTDTTIPALVSSETSFGYACIRSCGPFCAYPTYETQNVDVWKRKKRDKPLIFVWAVRAGKTKAVAFDWMFGPNAIPEMTAVAAAKPVGGDIQHLKEEYITKLVPVDKVMLLGGSIKDSKYAGWLIRTVRH